MLPKRSVLPVTFHSPRDTNQQQYKHKERTFSSVFCAVFLRSETAQFNLKYMGRSSRKPRAASSRQTSSDMICSVLGNIIFSVVHNVASVRQCSSPLPPKTLSTYVTISWWRHLLRLLEKEVFEVSIRFSVCWIGRFRAMNRVLVRQATCTCLESNLQTRTHKFWYFADRASQYIYLNINKLDELNFVMSLFHAFTCFEHHMLIVRRSKLYYTASGIITLKQVSGLKLLK